MIPSEAILETSATMIVGMLFVIAVAEALKIEVLQKTASMVVICGFGVLPFSVAAILALLELNDLAKWPCVVGFAGFAFWLSLSIYSWYKHAKSEISH